MPVITTTKEVTEAEAAEALRQHIDQLPHEPGPAYKRGDVLRSVTGCIGVVSDVDGGYPIVYWLDESGTIRGPSVWANFTEVDI